MRNRGHLWRTRQAAAISHRRIRAGSPRPGLIVPSEFRNKTLSQAGTAPSQYATRVNHLLGVTPGGLNGTTTLTLSQMTADGVSDSLDGGSELDWFFILDSGTIPGGLELFERIN